MPRFFELNGELSNVYPGTTLRECLDADIDPLSKIFFMEGEGAGVIDAILKFIFAEIQH